MDAIEADESVGAVVVTGTPPAFCAGANLGNLGDGRRRQPRQHLRGVPAHRPQPAAHARRGQRRGGRRRHEPRPRLRRAPRGPAGQVRHPVPADRPAPRRRPHVDVPAHRRAAGGDGGGRVRRGARRRRGRARRPRVPLRRRRRAARRSPTRWPPRAASAPRELAIVTKATIQAMADIDDHPAAVRARARPPVVEHEAAVVRRAPRGAAGEDLGASSP